MRRHLTTESLIGFAEGRLSTQSREVAEKHIQACPVCFAEISEWFSIMDSMKLSVLENPPDYAVRNCLAIYQISKPESVLQQVIATILFDSTLASATIGVRGVGDCQQVVFRASDVDVHLRIGGSPRIVLGQMLRREANHFLGGVPVTLLQADQQIEATITDELGEFRFGNAPLGNVRLHADLPSYRLIGDFTIKVQEIKQ
jgi:hypothetical protein